MAQEKPDPSPVAAYTYLVPILIEAARECGYALAVHGSMRRDLDLLAAPWTEKAKGPRALLNCVLRHLGWFEPKDRWRVIGKAKNSMVPERKPHGRVTWVIQFGGGPYIDLSVMPRTRRPRR